MVHKDTIAELIDAGGTALISMGKEMFVRRQEEKMLEKQAELDKEVELAKVGRRPSGSGQTMSAPEGRAGVVQTLGEAEDLADEYEDLLRRAEEMESCKLCKKLIRGARNRPVADQQELLPALQEFFSNVDDGTPTEEVARRVREHDELMQLIQETMRH